MADSSDSVEVILAEEAKRAITQIVGLLGHDVTEEEALQRCLGTELFLLQQVKNQNAKVFIESRNGRVELDLFSRNQPERLILLD